MTFCFSYLLKEGITIKKSIKIVLSLLILLIIGIATVCITQWDNIEAAVVGLRYEQDEIMQMQTDAKNEFATQTGIDLDAVEAIAENITPEGTPIVSGDNDAVQSENSSQPSIPYAPFPSLVSPTSPSGSETAPGVSHNSTDIQILLARFYALQSTFVGRLNAIKENAYAQYYALPKEERGTRAKIRIGREAVAEATALEAECDAQFNALLRELRAALTANGLDQSLASSVRQYYASEKSLLKAQYLSKYKEYLS